MRPASGLIMRRLLILAIFGVPAAGQNTPTGVDWSKVINRGLERVGSDAEAIMSSAANKLDGKRTGALIAAYFAFS